MSTEVTLPELSETVDTGVVANILVSVGDTIAEGQAVLEVETDKAVVEVPASVGGKVEAIHVEPGQEIKVGEAILTVTADEGEAEATDTAGDETPSEPQETQDVEETTAQEEAEPAPDGVQQGEEPSETESPQEQPEPAARSEPGTPSTAVDGQKEGADQGKRPLVPAAPSVRRLARELGIDITRVRGSGPGGRLSEDDVKEHARARQAAGPDGGRSVQRQELPDFSQWGPVTRDRMSGIRRATAENLSRSWWLIPHVTHFDKADITQLEAWRKRYGPRVQETGGKLTVTGILVKVLAAALKVYPQFNSSPDMENQELILKQYFHIGVAVDTEYGLLVPVIRDVDQKNLTEISVELTELSEAARARKLTMEQMQGASITISNLGGIGGTGFTPIVNEPQVAILGVSRGVVEPVYDGEDGFVPRTMLPLALSYDHRVIDGADAARFVRWVAETLEDPTRILLDG